VVWAAVREARVFVVDRHYVLGGNATIFKRRLHA
jgi:hypothetical protein